MRCTEAKRTSSGAKRSGGSEGHICARPSEAIQHRGRHLCHRRRRARAHRGLPREGEESADDAGLERHVPRVDGKLPVLRRRAGRGGAAHRRPDRIVGSRSDGQVIADEGTVDVEGD